MIIKNHHQANLLFIAIMLVVLILCQGQNVYESREWMRSGEAVRNVLTTFRLDYEDIPSTANLYFADLPQKRENAWIFPVGLPDGLWFIYREGTPHIDQVQSVSEAKQKIKEAKGKENLIFTIDQNGKVTRVE